MKSQTQSQIMTTTVRLNWMKLNHFKGIKSLEIAFKEDQTNILGNNGTGKSSIFDAFTWALFGKNHEDQQAFNFKPLDSDNNPIHHVETEVEVHISVNNQDVSIRRVNREKWTKRRGGESEFTGNETLLFWNDVPMKSGEFNDKISELINEDAFKLVTNPLYFNNLHWTKRRSMLEGLVESVTDSDVFAKMEADSDILSQVLADKTADEYSRELLAKKKKIKDSLQEIPGRIDELLRGKPEAQDFDAIEKEIEEVKAQVKDLSSKIESSAKQFDSELSERRSKMKLVSDKHQEIQDIKTNVRVKSRKALADFEEKQGMMGNQIMRLEREKEAFEEEIAHYKKVEHKAEMQLVEMRRRYEQNAEDEFHPDVDKLACSTCSRPYEGDSKAEIIQKMQDDFNNRVAETAKAITQVAEEVKVQKEEAIRKQTSAQKSLDETILLIEDAKQKKKDLEANAPKFDLTLDVVDEHKMKTLEKEIKELEKSIDLMGAGDSADSKVDELKAKREAYLNRQMSLNKTLAVRDEIARIESRVEELKSQERNLNETLSLLEGEEDALSEYNKIRMNELETRINSLFKVVRFKMFETKINGNETPACETLIGGVPFSDANTAAKIQAGLDIIRVFSDEMSISAPIFLDNRESVVSIPETTAQIINLIVNEKYSTLEIA